MSLWGSSFFFGMGSVSSPFKSLSSFHWLAYKSILVRLGRFEGVRLCNCVAGEFLSHPTPWVVGCRAGCKRVNKNHLTYSLLAFWTSSVFNFCLSSNLVVGYFLWFCRFLFAVGLPNRLCNPFDCTSERAVNPMWAAWMHLGCIFCLVLLQHVSFCALLASDSAQHQRLLTPLVSTLCATTWASWLFIFHFSNSTILLASLMVPLQVYSCCGLGYFGSYVHLGCSWFMIFSKPASL